MIWEIIVILSIVQGITEFLPISSSAHLILVPKIFAGINTERSFDVSLHFGSLLAVIIYLRNDIINILTDTIASNRKVRKGFLLFKNLIISTVPIVIFGLIISLYEIDILRSIEVIGWTTLIFGILLGIADKNLKVIKFIDNLKVKEAILIGLAQTLALIPGTSRSGIVMTTGLLMGYSRYQASKYSLFLSIPVIIAATTLESFSLYNEAGFFLNKGMALGILISFLVALITINLFMKWINKASLKIFVIYRIFLGVIILTFAYI